jgi:LysR family cyn operon transcriptional activator
MGTSAMSPRSLRYLLAVAEHKSFTRAADVLYVSQPTLSQQIKQLEESLRVQLLDRTGRTVRLTDAGEIYVQHARRALRELDAGQRAVLDLQDLSRGSLRVAMTPITDYLATPLLEAFAERYPGIELHVLEMCQEQIEVALASGQVDVGIAFTDMLSNDARSDEIEKHELFVESLNLVVGKTHPLARHRAAVPARALEEEPLAFLSSPFALRRHVDAFCREHAITPRVAMETNSVSVILEIVRRGRLATILPNALAVAQPGLRPLTLKPDLPPHTITLICRKGTYKSAACRAFGVLAATWCTERREAV